MRKFITEASKQTQHLVTLEIDDGEISLCIDGMSVAFIDESDNTFTVFSDDLQAIGLKLLDSHT